jgi:hypothetical protein
MREESPDTCDELIMLKQNHKNRARRSSHDLRYICANGTAVEGVCVTRRSNRPVNCPVTPGHCPGARRVWHEFLQSGYKAD